jgi:RpiB/LacA/LacB family sugar-phosphate isomerase
VTTRLVIGADHAGFALKQVLLGHLVAGGAEMTDVGTHDEEPVDYPDVAERLVKVVQAEGIRGILLCGSGVGASIAAAKARGIRAAVAHDGYSARQGVEHDDMNVLVLGARVVGVELAKTLVDAFLAARFSGEARHVRRLAKIAALEGR